MTPLERLELCDAVMMLDEGSSDVLLVLLYRVVELEYFRVLL